MLDTEDPTAELLTRLRATEKRLSESETRLAEANKLLQAIYHGEVAGEVVTCPGSSHLFTQDGTEHSSRVISEQQRAGETLLEGEKQYRLLFENMKDAFFLALPIYDEEGKPVDWRFLDANVAYATMTGFSLEQIIGRRNSELFPGAEPIWCEAIARVAQTGEPTFLDAGSDLTGRWYHVSYYSPHPGVTAAISSDITERKQAEEALERRGLARRLAEAQEIERQHIARELHDSLGQQLTALTFNLNMINSLPQSTTSGEVKELVERSLQLIDSAGGTIRNVMANLRPPALDDYGLLAALRQHCQGLARICNITFRLQESVAEIRISPEKEIALFRIAQEALMNIMRHAQANNVEISLTTHENCVSLCITDDGVGFDTGVSVRLREQPGWGILGMRERAEAIGGQLSIQSQPGAGTTITIEVEE